MALFPPFIFASCVFQAGIYWVTLIDQFAASWVVLFLVLLEIIGFCYIYGEYITKSCLFVFFSFKGDRETFNEILPSRGEPSYQRH